MRSSPWRPEAFHGGSPGDGRYEGWYYKMVDPAGRHPLAIIPGVAWGASVTDAHAFVQVLDSALGTAAYHRYEVAAFHASRERLDVHVGPNRFTRDALTLDLPEGPAPIRGTLRFSGQRPWPLRLLSPGYMGPLAFAPGLETYHAVLSFDHAVEGTLRIGGEDVDYAGGRGYMEKDWGHSFPRAWVWLQSNHFREVGTSLSAAVALIPWMGLVFRGFGAGLLHDGTLYRFATYLGSRTTRLDIRPSVVTWHVVSRGCPLTRRLALRLEIAARAGAVGTLASPAQGAMTQRVPEALDGEIAVRLVALRGGPREEVLYEGLGRHAGIEIVDPQGALAGYARTVGPGQRAMPRGPA